MASERIMPSDVLRTLEQAIEVEIGPRWVRIRQQFQRAVGELDTRWDSLILLYAHLLRLPTGDPALQKRRRPLKPTFNVISNHSPHRPRARSTTNPKPSQRPHPYHDCTQLVTAYNRSYASACLLNAGHSTWFAKRQMGAITRPQERGNPRYTSYLTRFHRRYCCVRAAE